MEKGKIIEALSKWNFWNKDIDTGIERCKTGEIFKSLKYNKVITIVGVRRSGKSYILKQIAQSLINKNIPKENILIVNFEEPKFENLELKTLLKIYDSFKEIIKPEGKPYIFLDEVQEVKNWEKFVRTLNETNEAYVTITGSSAKLLSSELSTILTGRQLTFEIFPLSFGEFLQFKNLDIKKQKDVHLNAEIIRKHAYEYIKMGGFPETVLIDDEEIKGKIIAEYYETIINRDIIQRYKIREIEKLKILTKYYITNISSPITFRSISKFIKIPTETISRFSEYLENAKMLFLVKKFSFSLKEQENSPRKIYCIDNGFFTSMGFQFRENLGKLMENAVAIELQRRKSENRLFDIYYWSENSREVDFVVKKSKKIQHIIQVCYNVENPVTKEREIKILLKASDKLDCNDLTIITWDVEKTEKIKNKTINYIPLWKWLLQI